MQPIILALDASTETCSVALLAGDSIIQRICHEPRTHAAQLLPMVDSILQESGLQLNHVDAIAYGAGPGSFTGLRIALSIAQGLAFGSNKNLVPVQSLQAMAFAINESSQTADTAICLLDARMDEFYLAAFQLKSAVPINILPAQLCAYDDFEKAVRPFLTPASIGLGGGWTLVKDDVKKLLAGAETQAVPLAAAVAKLGRYLLLEGFSVGAENAEPVYLRNSVSWNKRKRLRALPI